MGMGHREYRQVDPRSKIIKAMAGKVAVDAEPRRLLAILSAVDEAFIEQTRNRPRALRANMEFYKGVVCLSLGIPKEFFTVTFAAARAFGWVAHIVEQRQDNRLIRPSAHYVGPTPREGWKLLATGCWPEIIKTLSRWFLVRNKNSGLPAAGSRQPERFSRAANRVGRLRTRRTAGRNHY